MKFRALIGSLLLCVALFTRLGGIPIVHAETESIGDQIDSVCQALPDHKEDCSKCAKDSSGVWTAIGCIPTSTTGLFSKVFSLGIGIAGGIAFLLILFGGFQILVSAGNPEQLNEGRELVSSAVAGLLLIIFSVFLLKLIGYDILRIPGFTSGN